MLRLTIESVDHMGRDRDAIGGQPVNVMRSTDSGATWSNRTPPLAQPISCRESQSIRTIQALLSPYSAEILEAAGVDYHRRRRFMDESIGRSPE